MLSKERNRIQDGEWILEKVEDFSALRDFTCGDTDLDDYIRNDAAAHKRELLSETYILKEITVGTSFPVAFVSLCNDAIQLSLEKRKSTLPDKKRYPYLPAVKVARLGVHQMFQGRNIGTYLINMVKQLFLLNNRTGCRFITVDAYNSPRVIRFYQKNGFDLLHDKDRNRPTRIMYFDLKRLLTTEP
jgi:GNAT superfamily N-acetyltransferase